MKAIGFSTSLPIDDEKSLFAFETETPAPGPRDLLVRVRAVSVNPVDCKQRQRAAVDTVLKMPDMRERFTGVVEGCRTAANEALEVERRSLVRLSLGIRRVAPLVEVARKRSVQVDDLIADERAHSSRATVHDNFHRVSLQPVPVCVERPHGRLAALREYRKFPGPIPGISSANASTRV